MFGNRKQELNFAARIEEHNATLDRIEDLKRERGTVRAQLDQIRNRLPSYRQEVSTLQNQREVEKYRYMLEEAQDKLDSARHEESLLSARRNELESEIGALQTALAANQERGADIAELLEHSAALVAARDALSELENAIAEQEVQQDTYAHNDDDSEIDALQRRREDLMADLALGNARQVDVEAIDIEIEKQLKNPNGQLGERIEKHKNALHAIAGLRRKLPALREQIDELEQKTPAAIELFLRRQADELGSQYLKEVHKLTGLYRQLMALDEFAKRRLGFSEYLFRAPTSSFLLVPSFRTPCIDKEEQHKKDQGVLFDARSIFPIAESDVNAVGEQFRSMGLTDFF